MTKKPMCVRHGSHSLGEWCALKPGTTLDSEAVADATACDHWVMLRIGAARRMPTCKECREALRRTE